jgi:guanylate kinase
VLRRPECHLRDGRSMPSTDLFVLIGPSGVGKSSIVRALHRRGAITVLPTWTTRPARSGEIRRCLDHRFVDEVEFGRLARAGFFRVIGAHPGQRYEYGLPRLGAGSGRLAAVVLRANHVARVATPDTLVYQLCAPAALAEARLRRRGDRAEDVAVRMAAYEAEVAYGADLAGRCFRTDRAVPVVVAEILAALRADVRTDVRADVRTGALA